MGPARHTILFLVLTDTRGSLARSGEEKRAIGTWDVVACSGGRGEKEPFPRGIGSKRFFFFNTTERSKKFKRKSWLCIGYFSNPVLFSVSTFLFSPPLLKACKIRENNRRVEVGEPASHRDRNSAGRIIRRLISAITKKRKGKEEVCRKIDKALFT